MIPGVMPSAILSVLEFFWLGHPVGCLYCFLQQHFVKQSTHLGQIKGIYLCVGLFGTNPPVNGGGFGSLGGFVRALQPMGCFNFAISATAISLSS
ncbi:unnamed protein product [Prunus armeniaca]